MCFFCLVFHQSYSQQLWGSATQTKSNDKEEERTLVSPVSVLCYIGNPTLKDKYYPISCIHIYSCQNPTAAADVLLQFLLLRYCSSLPDTLSPSINQSLFFCPIPLSAATNSASLMLPSPIILSVSCMIQAHPSTFLFFYSKKCWKCEGHSSIHFSEMCRFGVLKSLLSFALVTGAGN